MNIGKFTILTNNISYLVCLNEFNIFLLIKHKAVVQYFLTDTYLPLQVVLLLPPCLYFFTVSFPFLFMLSSPSNQEFSFEKTYIHVPLERMLGFEGCTTRHLKWLPSISVCI